MEKLKRFSLVLCSIALLFPSVLSLMHISAHQEEVACTNVSDTHIHKKNLECELCDFRLTNLHTFTPVVLTFIEPSIPGSQPIYIYQILSDYQKLSFELRGPPASA